jgi:hypothetical protein
MPKLVPFLLFLCFPLSPLVSSFPGSERWPRWSGSAPFPPPVHSPPQKSPGFRPLGRLIRTKGGDGAAGGADKVQGL